MEETNKAITNELHWKWYATYFIAGFVDLTLRSKGIAPDLSFVIAYFCLFHICYWMPPKTAWTYGRFLLGLLGVLGWYFLVMRLFYVYLAAKFSALITVLLTISILITVPIVGLLLVQAVKTKIRK